MSTKAKVLFLGLSLLGAAALMQPVSASAYDGGGEHWHHQGGGYPDHHWDHHGGYDHWGHHDHWDHHDHWRSHPYWHRGWHAGYYDAWGYWHAGYWMRWWGV